MITQQAFGYSINTKYCTAANIVPDVHPQQWPPPPPTIMCRRYNSFVVRAAKEWIGVLFASSSMSTKHAMILTTSSCTPMTAPSRKPFKETLSILSSDNYGGRQCHAPSSVRILAHYSSFPCTATSLGSNSPLSVSGGAPLSHLPFHLQEPNAL